MSYGRRRQRILLFSAENERLERKEEYKAAAALCLNYRVSYKHITCSCCLPLAVCLTQVNDATLSAAMIIDEANKGRRKQLHEVMQLCRRSEGERQSVRVREKEGECGK